MIAPDSFEHAAIRFMLRRLQESARWSGCFLPPYFMYIYPDKSINLFWVINMKFLNMIGLSGGRQSLYTSRPWGLKPLNLTAQHWKVSERRKNPWLEPAAIRLTLKRLQESARWSGCFLLAFFKLCVTTSDRAVLTDSYSYNKRIKVNCYITWEKEADKIMWFLWKSY